MMRDKKDIIGIYAKFRSNNRFNPQLFCKKISHRIDKKQMRFRKVCKRHNEITLKFTKWLFVKNNVIKIISANISLLKAKIDNLLRKRCIMFFSRKSLKGC